MAIKLGLISLLLFVVALSTPLALAAENDDLKKNICGGANLSLSEGGTAAGGFNRSCDNPSDGSGNPEKKLEDTIAKFVNIFSVIVGIVAVIMVIIGGFKYITSGGDAGRVSSAKNTVIYAVVGLIIVALAQFIVQFVITKSAPVGTP